MSALANPKLEDKELAKTLMSQIHAREITTGDVSWRWIDYLVNGYSTDSTVKALLDSTEMWVVPIARMRT